MGVQQLLVVRVSWSVKDTTYLLTTASSCCVLSLCVLADCQSPCPDELGGVPHVAIVPIKALNSSQKEIIAGEERPKYFAANNKIDNSQGGLRMMTVMMVLRSYLIVLCIPFVTLIL